MDPRHNDKSRFQAFRLLYSNCLNWKFTAKITYHLHVYPQFVYESFHIHYIISLLSREKMNSQLTSLPMCGFIAQLVEHRTGIAKVTGSNPVEALIFFQASLFQLLKLEIHCEDHISPSYHDMLQYPSSIDHSTDSLSFVLAWSTRKFQITLRQPR